jgi:sulfite reductase beta subunit-like hemoprotein
MDEAIPRPPDWTQDIAWLAAYGPDGSVGYRLLIGGMQGPAPHLGWHLPVFVRPKELREVTRVVSVNWWKSI